VKEERLSRQGESREAVQETVAENSVSIKGVLFDFDGTLTVPGAIQFDAIKQDLGCPLNQPILEYIGEQPAEKRARLKEILESHEIVAAKGSIPNRGVTACLGNLGKMKIPFGILTRNSLRSIKTALLCFPRFSMSDFAVVITRDDSLPKPHPDGVIKAAGAMGFSPEELLVVGDFRFDMIAGKNAGAKTAYLTNGGKTTMEEGDPEPDFMCRYLMEVIDIIRTFNSWV